MDTWQPCQDTCVGSAHALDTGLRQSIKPKIKWVYLKEIADFKCYWHFSGKVYLSFLQRCFLLWPEKKIQNVQEFGVSGFELVDNAGLLTVFLDSSFTRNIHLELRLDYITSITRKQ